MVPSDAWLSLVQVLRFAPLRSRERTHCLWQKSSFNHYKIKIFFNFTQEKKTTKYLLVFLYKKETIILKNLIFCLLTHCFSNFPVFLLTVSSVDYPDHLKIHSVTLPELSITSHNLQQHRIWFTQHMFQLHLQFHLAAPDEDSMAS